MAWCVLEEWGPMRSCWPYHWRNVGRFPWQMGGIGDDRFEAKWGPHFWCNSSRKTIKDLWPKESIYTCTQIFQLFYAEMLG